MSDTTIIRPPQGAFSSDEKMFLKSFLLQYSAMIEELGGTGPKGIGGVKGNKKDWILKHVYPPYVKRFDSDGDGGPNLQSLEIVCFLFSSTATPPYYELRKSFDGS